MVENGYKAFKMNYSWELQEKKCLKYMMNYWERRNNESFVNVLIGVGCPGAHALISNLKLQDENIFILGTNANEQAIGRWICDDFAVVHNYFGHMKKIILIL